MYRILVKVSETKEKSVLWLDNRTQQSIKMSNRTKDIWESEQRLGFRYTSYVHIYVWDKYRKEMIKGVHVIIVTVYYKDKSLTERY